MRPTERRFAEGSWQRVVRPVIVMGVMALMAASGLSPAGKARASTSVAPALSTSYNVHGALYGVAAISPDNAWAVGATQSSAGVWKALLLHWNGRTWQRVAVPGGYGYSSGLSAVAAVSATDVYAVGDIANSADGQPLTLVLHWDGKSWRRVLKTVGFGATAVAATPQQVWVATMTRGNFIEFLHLTGGRWYVVPVSQPANPQLQPKAVTVVSPTLVFAGGIYFDKQGRDHDFLMRWNGSVWKITLQTPVQGQSVWGMASGPDGVAWAVGQKYGGDGNYAVSMHWSGKSWRAAPGPSPLFDTGGFDAVAFIPGGTAWAVGFALTGDTLIAHWTRNAWTWVAAPTPASCQPILEGIAATSNRDAWTVGYCFGSETPPYMTEILHWNGKTWS